MKLFDDTSKGILENFQNAYLSQIGKRMTIGSEEYILSSIFTYVLASYVALINKAYDNRFLDTASGVYLNNIAKQYNLDRKPISFGNPFFEGTFSFDLPMYYAAGEYEINLAGHTYKNVLPISAQTVNTFNRFVCTEEHSEYLDAKTIEEALAANNAYIAGNGLQNCAPEMTDDNEFREYIKQNKRLYSPGIAESFEAAAKSYADYVLDAKVLRQSEVSYFEPGKVILMLKVNDNKIINEFANNGLDQVSLQKVIDDLNILVVGQTLEIRTATRTNTPTVTCRVQVYVPKSYEGVALDTYVVPKHCALARYYNKYKLKIGQSLYLTEFMSDMSKPLSDLSTNPADFGLSQEAFDRLNNFYIKGFNLTNTADKIDPANSLCYLYMNEIGPFLYSAVYV